MENETLKFDWEYFIKEDLEQVKLPTAQIPDEILKRGLEKAI